MATTRRPRRRLTVLDRRLLAEFSELRAEFDRAIAASGMTELYTCPACGFPSLKERHRGARCVLCQWIDSVDEAKDWLVGPNVASLRQRRIDVSLAIGNLDVRYEIDRSLELLVHCFRGFEARLSRGEQTIEPYFEHHLLHLLPTTSRLP